jgi:hypothetical protein
MEKQIHKEWTEEELNNLPELYKTNSIRQIALLLNRTYDGVSAKINRLKLKKIRLSKPKPILKELLINQGKDWTIEDELILKQKYESKSNRELSEILKRDKGSLMKKANSMGLYKSNKKRSEVAKKWTQEEDNKLKEVYNLMTNANIAELFNASLTSVEHRAAKFGLRKTKEYISKVHTGVKRTTGRNLTFEFVKEIASKYKSKAEFQTKDCSAYNIALRRGWLDKICSHMLSLRYGSLPQLVLRDFIKQLFKLDNSGVLYSTRKVIKPLELDVWVPIYKLAFEYDGAFWHKEENNKIELCDKIGVKLIVIKETKQRNEIHIKKQLIEKLNVINKQTGLLITPEQINVLVVSSECYDMVLNKDDIHKICQTYMVLNDFKIEQSNLYDKICKRGLVKEFTGHMKRRFDRNKWNVETVTNTVNKYVTLKDFREKEENCYNYILNHDELRPLLECLEKTKVSNSFWADDKNIINVVEKYTILRDFKENESACYSYIIKHPEKKHLISHLEKNIHKVSFWINPENIINAVSEYTTLKEFMENEPSCYKYINEHPENKHFIEHLQRKQLPDGYWGNIDNMTGAINGYVTLKDFAANESACYSYMLKHKEYMPLISHLEKGQLPSGFWKNPENVIKVVSQYTTLKDFRENEPGCYSSVIKNKDNLSLIARLKKFGVDNDYWSDPKNIIEAARNHITLNDFRKQYPTAYGYIMKNKELLQFIEHLEKEKVPNGYWSNPENIKKVVNKYEWLSDFRANEKACVSYIYKHQEMLPLIAHLKKYKKQSPKDLTLGT